MAIDTDNTHPFPVAPRSTAYQRPGGHRLALADAALDALIAAAAVQERAQARAAVARGSMTRGRPLARLQFILADAADGPLGAVVIALCFTPACIALVLRLGGAL